MAGVVAFQTSLSSQRYGIRHADQTTLFVQQMEPPQQQEEEQEDASNPKASAPQNLYFAQGDVQTPSPDEGFDASKHFAADSSEDNAELIAADYPKDNIGSTVANSPEDNAESIANDIPEDSMESISADIHDTVSAPASPAPQSTMFHPKAPSAGQELLEAVLDVTVAGSMALLVSTFAVTSRRFHLFLFLILAHVSFIVRQKGLRYTAATALTATLPDQERYELLSRMKPKDIEETTEAIVDASEEEEEEDARGSVQEEIALAIREEARKNEQQWQQEKERITQQLEAAAEARIKAELEVQQQRLEKEKKVWETQNKVSTEKAMASLQQTIASLEAELQRATAAKKKMEEDSSRALQKAKADLAKKQQDQIVFETRELEQVEVMLKKRKEQQAMLEKVEKDLREKAHRIKMEKEELLKLEQQQKQQQNLQKDDIIEEQIDDSVPHLSPKEYRGLSQEEKGQLKEMREATKGTTEDDTDSPMDHPVLGPVVADLGYKRIHLVSSGKLGTIPIWKRQRTYRNDRARRMASDKQSTLHLGFPGIICLHEDSKGALSILDGQHRVGMMQTIREMQNKNSANSDENTDQYFQNVLVEVYSDADQDIVAESRKDKSIAEQVFVEINKAEPLKLLDMPGVASAADRKLITEAVETLQEQFPKMFSTSQRCRAPNVNIDNLRNSIYGANILQRYKEELTTSGKLVEWLLMQNAALGDMYENDEKKQKYVSHKAWTKASKNGFYLGLESSWLFV
jgi:hypothetical protein